MPTASGRGNQSRSWRRTSRSRPPRSKRRCATSSPTPPDPVVFLVDRCLGSIIVAERLRDAGLTVEIHRDHFHPEAPDVEWLADAGRRGWIVLTQDKHIRHRELEVRALREANVRAIVIGARNAKGAEIGAVLVRHLATIRWLIEHEPPPFIALVSREGVRLRKP